jgi:hypothetical protein
MIDKGLFSFLTTVACTILLLILSYFIDSPSNVTSVQYLTQEVYGSLGIGDNITEELSTQVPAIQNITAGGSSNNHVQSIGNMTEVPVNKINSTNLIAISPEALQSTQVGNDTTTNRTVIVIPPQPVQSKPTLNEPSIIGPPRIMQSNPQGAIESGDMRVNISAIKPITKEQAAKAEQEANVMIKDYYEKLDLEKQKEKEEALATTAAVQSNQTGEEETEEAEDTTAESEIGIEEEEEEEEEGEEEDEDNNNEDENNEDDDE